MRIVTVGTNLPTKSLPFVEGGAEKSRMLIQTILAELKHDVIAVRGHGYGLGAGANDSWCEENDSKVVVVTVPFPVRAEPRQTEKLNSISRGLWHWQDDFNRSTLPLLDALFGKYRPDVVLTHNLAGFSTAVWQAARKAGAKVVHYIHDFYLLCPRSTMYRHGTNCDTRCGLCKLFTIKRIKSTALVDAVIANSEFIDRLHADHALFPNARQYVIYPYVSTQEAAEAPPRGDRAMTFGFLGRVVPAKGLDDLVLALAGIDKPFRLLVGGRIGDEDKARLEAMLPAGTIEFLGFVQPGAFFARIDVLVVPSLWREPFGRVAVEAMDHGVPVIVPHHGGLAEIAATGGWTYTPGSVDALRDTLEIAITSPAMVAQKAAQARSSAADLSRDRMKAAWTRVLAELAADPTPHRDVEVTP